MRCRLLLPAVAALLALPSPSAAAARPSVRDTPFWQEYHEACPLPSAGENDVRALAVGPDGTLWAATGRGVRYRDASGWKTPEGGVEVGATHGLCVDGLGRVWVAAWNGLCHATRTGVRRAAPPQGPVSAVGARGSTVYAITPEALWRSSDGQTWQRLAGRQWHRAVRAILPATDGRVWIGTASGLFLQDPDTARPAIRLGTPDTLLSSSIYALEALPGGEIAVGSSGGVDFYRGGRRLRSLTAAKGLPNRYAQAITRDVDGRLWIGTRLGIARYDGREWRLRHSRRWLQSDDVRDVAIGPDGTAWVATAAGVDAIRRRRMTLADKAAYYLEVLRARHLRPPGLVGPAVLPAPGDLSKSFVEDDDNDGQHTGQYLAVESLRYAVTRDPAARENAKAAFRALCFLREATGTPHLIARSVLPIEIPPRHEGDRTFTPEEVAEIHRRDPREKIIERRWLPTADGRWRWKRDASSDEVVGHLFGYALYHDLAADEAEKRRVVQQVDRIVGGIVGHGWVLRDIDGRATQWGNWSPASLNGDPTWHEERSGNSAEILAHLGVAYHVTGNARYRDAARQLVERHGYGRNLAALAYPTPSERTHINDDLLSMVFPNLFTHLVVPELRPAALAAIRRWHRTCRADGIPVYDFVYNRFSGRPGPLGPAAATLREWPLDQIEWTVDNRQRDDVTFDRTPGVEEERLTRVLPRSEMGMVMWDGDPYRAVHGRSGEREEKGTDWLLAYWMGRYWGLVRPPERTQER